MMKYRETQMQIHMVLKEFKHGRLNSLLIDPKELNDHLDEIQNKLGFRHKLPSTNYVEMEDLVNVAVTHGNSCLLFHIELPLLTTVDFDLYKLIPVPPFIKNMFIFIQPSNDFLAINIQTQSYYLMNNQDYTECNKFKETLICEEHHPIFPVQQNNHCEVNIFLHDYKRLGNCNFQYSNYPQFWIELSQTNQLLFALSKEETIKQICRNDITSSQIDREGIIDIPAGCFINLNGVRIYGKNISYSNFISKRVPPIFPQMKLTWPLQMDLSEHTVVLKLNDMKSISDSIQNLKTEESLPLAPIPIPNDDSDDINLHQWITYVCFWF